MTPTQAEATRHHSESPMLGPITHVAITVRDIDVSAPWYAALIGSAPVLDEDTGPFRHAVFAVGGTLLGLHQFPEGIEELPFSPRRRGIDHVAFAAAGRSNRVAWGRRLTQTIVPPGEV